MTRVTDLPDIDALADGDFLYVYDISNPSTPDRKITGAKLRPSGARLGALYRFSGSITIPAIAAGAEGEATISMPGVVVGDHALFNLRANLPANLGILHAWVQAADAVTVRFRNFHASTGYAGASIACAAVVFRTTD